MSSKTRDVAFKPASNAPSDGINSSKRPQQRSWRRRITRIVVTLCIIAGVLRIALAFVLPQLIHRTARRYGLNCNYDRLAVSVLRGKLELSQLELWPLDETDRVFRLEYCRADAALGKLLKGQLVFPRIEVDGVTVFIERISDGSFPLLDLIQSANAASEDADTAGSLGTPIDFRLPVQIGALRVQHAQLQFRDESMQPPFEALLEMNLRVSDLGSTQPALIELLAISPQLLDQLHLTVNGTTSKQAFDGKFELRGRGLRIEPLAPYLKMIEIHSVAEQVSFDLSAQFDAKADQANAGSITGGVTVNNLRIIADGETALSLDQVTLAADRVDSDSATISRIEVEGAAIHLSRNESAVLGFAGLEYRPQGASKPLKTSTGSSTQDVDNGDGFTWVINDLHFRDLQASLRDAAVTPAAELSFNVDDLKVSGLGWAADGDPENIEIVGQMSLPGVAQIVTISGEGTSSFDHGAVEIHLDASGIRLDALKPYLSNAGIESHYQDGNLSCTVIAGFIRSEKSLVAKLAIEKLELHSTDQIVAMERLALDGVRIDSKNQLQSIDRIDLQGTRVSLKLDAEGGFHALGLRWIGRSPVANKSGDETFGNSTKATPTQSSPTPLNFKIGEIRWNDNEITYTDELAATPISVSFEDIGMELKDLVITRGRGTLAPCAFNFWAAASDLIEHFEVKGTVAADLLHPVIDIEVSAKGIRTDAIASILRSVGLDPAIEEVTAHFVLNADISLGEQITATIRAQDVYLNDGGSELFALDGLSVENAVIQSGSIDIESIEIAAPRAQIGRDVDGAILVAGMKLLPQSTEAAPAESKSQYPDIRLSQLGVHEALIQWSDLAVDPVVETSASLSCNIKDLHVGGEHNSAKFDASFSIADVLGQLRLIGAFNAGPQVQQLNIAVDAEGIHPAPLAGYWNQGPEINVADGVFRIKFRTMYGAHDSGGHKLRLTINDLDYHDKGGATLLKLDEMHLDVNRVDLLNQMVDVDQISISGLETEIRRATDGVITAFGLSFPTCDNTSAQIDADEIAPRGEPVTATGGVLPLLKLGKLDLDIRRLSLIDQMGPDSLKIEFADVSVENRKSIEVLGDNPDGGDPIELEISGRIDPLLESFSISTVVAPFASAPFLKANVTASGIRGNGLLQLLGNPVMVDGSTLDSGEFKGQMELNLKLTRQNLMDFDLSRDFSMDLLVQGLSFSENGVLLAGFDEVFIDVARIDLPQRLIHARNVEITNPQGSMTRNPDGIYFFGLRFPPSDRRSTQPEDPTSASDAPDMNAQTAASVGEVRIDEFVISDIDFRYIDNRTTPPVIIPLREIDLVARDFTTKSFSEPLPISFTLTASGGEVEVNDTASSAERDSGGDIATPVFEQIAVTGNLVMVPELSGWLKGGVEVLDLNALKGVANQLGFEVRGGVLDANIDLRFVGEDKLDTFASLTFTDLSLSEPPDGPVSKALSLPAPLEVVLLVLSDQTGQIHVPLHFRVSEGGLSTAEVVKVAFTATSKLIARAVANSPFRIADTAIDLITLAKQETQSTEQSVSLKFDEGSTVTIDSELVKLKSLVDLLRTNEHAVLTLHHELGADDVRRANIFANPSRDQCIQLTYRLRQKKKQILDMRTQTTSSLRSANSIGLTEEADQQRNRLAGLNRDLGLTERALDQVLDLVRPGAERQSKRRTREACIAIGAARLKFVRQSILDMGGEKLEPRIRLMRPRFGEAKQHGTVIATPRVRSAQH